MFLAVVGYRKPDDDFLHLAILYLLRQVGIDNEPVLEH
jgi:hypothetical protein